ncbi:MAG: hypothetical protein M0Z58_05115 [Nitrospiraceae bacterium]|nr:hypothetical protein [Nitrospiraceae bacterium]
MSGGKVLSINISEKKGTRKKPVQSAYLREDHGIEGDAHASALWGRQLSLLAIESIRRAQARQYAPGDFAENITTEGLVLTELAVGSKLKIGRCLTEVTQIGKRCHEKCEIYKEAGDCIMPKEGIFVKIIAGGWVRQGDPVTPL